MTSRGKLSEFDCIVQSYTKAVTWATAEKINNRASTARHLANGSPAPAKLERELLALADGGINQLFDNFYGALKLARDLYPEGEKTLPDPRNLHLLDGLFVRVAYGSSMEFFLRAFASFVFAIRLKERRRELTTLWLEEREVSAAFALADIAQDFCSQIEVFLEPKAFLAPSGISTGIAALENDPEKAREELAMLAEVVEELHVRTTLSSMLSEK